MTHCTLAGLPPLATYAALALAVALTAWAVLRPTAVQPSTWRFDLLSLRPVRWLVSRRAFQFSVQLPLVLMLFLILWAGFAGSPVAERNFATVATWTIWWTLLIVDIVLLGRMWCLVCPWDALASWLRRLAFWRRRQEEPLALDLPWPRWLKNVYPATVLFVGLTWLELGFGVTQSPRATATLGLLMVLLAVLPALIFERKSFCRYGCLVGRICGLYSLLAPVEVRARDLGVCRTCHSKECLQGNGEGYPCPTGQCLAGMTSNTYCTVCTECIKTCSKGNVALNLRPWGTDLGTLSRPKNDEAVLALVMLSLTSFHGLTMTPVWGEALAWVRGATGLAYLTAFTLGMTLILALPALLYRASSALFTHLARPREQTAERPAPTRWIWGRYAYPLIAVALMYHLAHNAGHFLTEAGTVVPVLSDPLGRGVNLFGTADFSPGPLASQGWVWTVQVGLVLLGLVWALRATERAHEGLVQEWRLHVVPLKARATAAGFILVVSLFNLWLLTQPMEMRTGM